MPAIPSAQHTQLELGIHAEHEEWNGASEARPVAIDTPRSSQDSQRSRDFWEDDDELEQVDAAALDQDQHGEQMRYLEGSNRLQAPQTDGQPFQGAEISPVIGTIKRKPVARGKPSVPVKPDQFRSTSHEFSSNNPYRREVSSERAPFHDSSDDHSAIPDLPHWGSAPRSPKGKGKEVDRNPVPDNQLSHDHFQDAHRLSSSFPGSVPPHPIALPPPVPRPRSPASQQPPLIPVTPPDRPEDNPWISEKIVASAPQPAAAAEVQKEAKEQHSAWIDQGQETGVISVEDDMDAWPEAVPLSSHHICGPADAEDDNYQPPLPARPAPQGGSALLQKTGSEYEDAHAYAAPEGPPPPMPPRPAAKTQVESDGELARMIQQRNETYQIKHFNWFDHRSGKLRQSSMLIQNKNGPCPLLALVNALILGSKDESQAVLDNALSTREQVSLGLIIETLMDELLSASPETMGGLPDVDELNRFLLMLHAGMNANPKMTNSTGSALNLMDARNSILHLPPSEAFVGPGGFEATSDVKLYGAFAVPLVHGWLPSPGSETCNAFSRSAQTYEDAQALLFGEEELEYKRTRGGLTETEQQLWEDIMSIKAFFTTYPTQLTPYGLETIESTLARGDFAIMFRNDHFSTIYKHPDTGKLFTLITDAGYADRDEIIWETLADWSGQHSEFFSGDFRPVGNNVEPTPPGRFPSEPSSVPPVTFSSSAAPMSPQELQAQADADFAMALQLQEEEEQHAKRARRRSHQGRSDRSSNDSNIPIRLHPVPQESRPLIPPRTQRAENVGVNRPSDLDLEDAPPAYEEAAKGKPYQPPVGSPHHPDFHPIAVSPTVRLTPAVGVGSSGSNTISPVSTRPQEPRRPQQRRMSAYSENQGRFGYGSLASPASPGASGRRPSYPFAQPAAVGSSNRLRKNEDRDCIVM